MRRPIFTIYAERWGLSLNLSKCGILGIGHRGEERDSYEIQLGGVKQKLNIITSEKTWVFWLMMNWNSRLKRNFRNIGRNTFWLLYKSMVRSKLEYAQNVWSPYKMKYIERIEKVQRWATKLLPNMSKMSYEQRLRKIGLPTLTYRRVRAYEVM